MRHRFLSLLALLVAFTVVVAACGGGTTTSDPYQIVSGSMKAPLDPVQVNIGFELKDGATTVSIDPSALAFVASKADGTAAVHVSIPAAALGSSASMLTQFGITGSTIDLDVVYDGTAVYGRSPLFATLLTMILQPSGDLPSGDLAGWLQLVTTEDLKGLAGTSSGSGNMPSFAVPSAGDGPGFKAALEEAGITLQMAGTEQHDGADAYHLTVAIESTKLLANKALDSVSRAQLDEMSTALKSVTLSGDLWVDKASNRIVEFDGHAASTADSKQSGTLTIKIGSPDGSVSTAAPSSFLVVPFKSIVTNVMSLVGQGLTGG
ncbi:MAG: hypothetical protein ABI573_04810 [Chloroflexota bacterium]